MTQGPQPSASDAVQADADNRSAPDPRRHYDSPEDLREDVDLDLPTREKLLREWKLELDSRLEAESEGMSASDPIASRTEGKLAAEARRVSKALEQVVDDLKKAG